MKYVGFRWAHDGLPLGIPSDGKKEVALTFVVKRSLVTLDSFTLIRPFMGH